MHKNLTAAALGQIPADLVLKNCQIVDVFSGSIYRGNIAIAEGCIAGIGDYHEAKASIDLDGAYVAPGLINSHCHVESSMTTPENYCAQELRHGVTTLITDPHEIANVAGLPGISYMLAAGRSMPINYYVQLPSCVPATPFEHSGCILEAADLEKLADTEGVLGLGEVMNVPGVLTQTPELLAKLHIMQSRGRGIDGHSPGLTGRALQAYIGSGIETEHEATSWQEAKEKLRSGMAILVREGSASKNLEAIITGALAEKIDFSRMAFCTDDKHFADIQAEGTIRFCMQKAVSLGLAPITAIQMATYNAARIYSLKHLGAIAPGMQADITVFEDLTDFDVRLVLHKGRDTAKLLQTHSAIPCPEELLNTVQPAPFSAEDFTFSKFLPGKKYPVINIIPGELLTDCSYIDGSKVEQAVKNHELCLIAVIERHHRTGNIGLGLIAGYGLTSGATATTIAHDSHNIIIIGTSAADMTLAGQELIRCQGGYTLVRDGKVVRTLPLKLCGLMSDVATEQLVNELKTIKELAHAQGVVRNFDPFVGLSFMALPVIPKVKITDMGMFDTVNFKFIE